MRSACGNSVLSAVPRVACAVEPLVLDAAQVRVRKLDCLSDSHADHVVYVSTNFTPPSTATNLTHMRVLRTNHR